MLVFDTGSAESFSKLQRYWLAQVQRQRLYLIRQTPGSTVVLAHIVDEVRSSPSRADPRTVRGSHLRSHIPPARARSGATAR